MADIMSVGRQMKHASMKHSITYAALPVGAERPSTAKDRRWDSRLQMVCGSGHAVCCFEKVQRGTRPVKNGQCGAKIVVTAKRGRRRRKTHK